MERVRESSRDQASLQFTVKNSSLVTTYNELSVSSLHGAPLRAALAAFVASMGVLVVVFVG